jgi:hypothetical protein
MLRRWKPVLVVAAVPLLAAAASIAQGADAGPVVWPAANLKWVPAVNAPPGVMQAVLWGDPAVGAYGSISKFPGGFSVPLHTHSPTLRIVVISGTIIHGSEGKPDVRLGPGSYMTQTPTYRHTTACDKASECVFFIEADGKFDVKLVGEAPAK